MSYHLRIPLILSILLAAAAAPTTRPEQATPQWWLARATTKITTMPTAFDRAIEYAQVARSYARVGDLPAMRGTIKHAATDIDSLPNPKARAVVWAQLLTAYAYADDKIAIQESS